MVDQWPFAVHESPRFRVPWNAKTTLWVFPALLSANQVDLGDGTE
jgi:hypothetical protein